MVNVIVCGHGGYAGAVQSNLQMLMGPPEGFYFVDFMPGDDLPVLDKKIEDAIKLCSADEILFACDLTGGSPFRQCATLCISNKNYRTVAGLNPAAYAEMVYNLSEDVDALIDLAIDAAKFAIARFPEKAE